MTRTMMKVAVVVALAAVAPACGTGDGAGAAGGEPTFAVDPDPLEAGEPFALIVLRNVDRGIDYVMTGVDGPAKGRVWVLSRGDDTFAPTVTPADDGPLIRLVAVLDTDGSPLDPPSQLDMVLPEGIEGSTVEICSGHDESACGRFEVAGG